jgi:hypothetical protein
MDGLLSYLRLSNHFVISKKVLVCKKNLIKNNALFKSTYTKHSSIVYSVNVNK